MGCLGRPGGQRVLCPWPDSVSRCLVNGIDVIPLVEAELNHRFPVRADSSAADPDGMRATWATGVHRGGTLERVAAMPTGMIDVSISDDWSVAQTMRHLVMATDLWLGRAIFKTDQPGHLIDQAGPDAEDDGLHTSILTTDIPSYAEVLEVRAGRVAMVRDFLADVTSGDRGDVRRLGR